MRRPAAKSSRKRTGAAPVEPASDDKDQSEDEVSQNLAEIFSAAGWTIESEVATLIALFQRAIDELLVPDSVEHRRFLSYISEKLSDSNPNG